MIHEGCMFLCVRGTMYEHPPRVRRSVAHGQISMALAHRITTQIEDTNREVYHSDTHGLSTMKGAAKC